MANWDNHRLSAVGPPKEMARFVNDFEIVSGAIDMGTGEVLEGWGRKPWMKLGPGRHIIEKCIIGLCCVEIDFESANFVWPEGMYRALAREYPTLHFQWRYWLDADCGVGYVDETGDHRYHEDLMGEDVAIELAPEPEYPDRAIEAERAGEPLAEADREAADNVVFQAIWEREMDDIHDDEKNQSEVRDSEQQEQ
jgi:hypothetical protein